MVIVTLLVLGKQLLKLMVHVKTYTPGIKPVTVVEGRAGSVIVGVLGPLSNVHAPVPINGVLPARVVEAAAHRFCAAPADAVVGPAWLVIVTSESLLQVPLLIVHLNIYTPGTKPVIVVFGEAGVMML